MIDLSSLSTMHWLLISNCVLLVMVVLGFMVVRHQYQKELKSWQHKTQKIQNDYDAVSRCTVGMGRRLKKLEHRVVENERKPALATADEALFQQAQRLVDMGATADDLVTSCGVARAEAELLVSMNRQPAH